MLLRHYYWRGHRGADIVLSEVIPEYKLTGVMLARRGKVCVNKNKVVQKR